MTIPDYQTLMRPVLEAAVSSPSDISILEISEGIAQKFGVTADELEIPILSGTQPLFHNRLHWAKTYLSKAGLVQSPRRGRFTATTAGRDFLKNHNGPITVNDLARFPEFQTWRASGRSAGGVEDAGQPEVSAPAQSAALSPDDLIDHGIKQINAQLVTDILRELKNVHPKRFEAIVADFLKAMGFGGRNQASATVTQYSSDGGIDGIIHEDALGLDAIYIQAKRYTDRIVGQPEVQQFVGALAGYGAEKGVFVTTSSFSKQAEEFVQKTSKRIVLIDGEKLAQLFLKYGVGVRTKRIVEVRAIDRDYFLGD